MKKNFKNESGDSSEQVSTRPSKATENAVTPESDEKIVELTNDLQRTRADFENFRKQTDLQKSQAMSAARYATVKQLLPLIDDFSRAITTYPEQLQPLSKSLQKSLENLGITIINSDPGVEFNPDLHEAVFMSDGDGDLEIISETLRPGYFYDGVVIRPAMVKVERANSASA